MIARHAPGWQLILADLALILFLVTLAALATASANDANGKAAPNTPAISAAHALFRPEPGGPSLAEWLTRQQPDPRSTVTVFAQYSNEDETGVWNRARALSGSASREGFAVRVVITKGETSEIYASLAYDVPKGPVR